LRHWISKWSPGRSSSRQSDACRSCAGVASGGARTLFHFTPSSSLAAFRPCGGYLSTRPNRAPSVSQSPPIQARNISSNSIISTHVTVHGLNAHANVAHPIIILQPIPIRYPCFITHATCELSSTATVHGVKWLRLLSIQPSSDQDHNSKLLPAKREILSRTDGLPGGEGVSPLVVAEVRVVAREHEPDMPVLLESEHQY
jgi:hypothetical protein